MPHSTALRRPDAHFRTGDRLSRPRGDAGEDSDYDVAVFLNDLKEGDLANRWRELDRLADLRSDILSDTEAFIDAKPCPAGAYPTPTALMGEIRGRRSVTPEIGENFDFSRVTLVTVNLMKCSRRCLNI